MDYINEACEKFKALLEEQVARAERIANDKEKFDFKNYEKLRIGIMGGDGIGPIITREAKRVLAHVLDEDIKSGKIELVDIEGLTIENRKKVNKPIPDDVLAEIKTCPVLLKGPTETPKGGTLGSANVAMRSALDLYSNIRPVTVKEKNIDWIFFRENTEGEYVLGSKGVEIPDLLACDFKVTTNVGTERIARAGFEYARANGKKNVAIVTKANILKKTDGKFTEICHEVAKDYPEMNVEDWYIDIMTANLINEARQSSFEVFILPNLYGDIITDEAAQIQGGVGTAGSANVGDKYAMFEAIHGSAPRMIETGRGEFANPASMIKATAMLLRHIGKIDKANEIENALFSADKEVVITGRADGATAKQFGDYVISKL